MSEALLEVRKVSVAYGAIAAVNDVDLTINRGQIVTVIGPNGAGKTSLLKGIAGLLKARGSIRYKGGDIGHLAAEQRTVRGISLVPEGRELFASMSVADNLALGAFPLLLRGVRRTPADIEALYVRFPRLKERARQRASTLSGGERQMLAFGRALMSKPDLLMLDEPSLGLAPVIVAEVFRTIASLRESGVSVLLVEQNARAALQVADYGYVLETGSITLQGPAAEIAQDPRVVSTYIGSGRRRGED